MSKKGDKKERMDKPYSLWQNIKYIYHVLFQEVKLAPLFLFVGIFLGIVIPILNTLVTTVAVGTITSGGGVKAFVLVMFAVLAVFGGLTSLNRWIGAWNDFYISHVQSRKFLMGLLEKSLSTDYDNIEPQKQQALLSGASHAVHVYRQGVNLMYMATPAIVSSIAGIIVYSATITFFDVRILLLIVVMHAIGVLLSLRAVRIQQSYNPEQYRLWGRDYCLKTCTMSVESGKDIRIYNMKKWFEDGFLKLKNRNRVINKKKNEGFALASMTAIGFSCVRDILTYGVLISQVLDGRIGLAEFTLGLGVVTGFSAWVSQLQWSIANLNEGNAMLNEYRKMMDFPDRFKRGTGLGIKDIMASYQEGTLSIDFQHVSFRYQEDGPDILRDVNFSIAPGEKIALVGHNGAGKTTLIKLLCGLYHPTEGRILVGGHDIEEFNLDEYHMLLSTIFQETNILPLSILENVSGKVPEESDRALVAECLEKAGLSQKVEQYPKKEMTYMSQMFDDEGVQFSGGMAQKLMMARAMYKQAPILVLDEPTAALDPIAESRLYEEYNEFSRNKTSIFISHRLASTRFCDRIIFLEQGTVLEEGTHAELMQRNGKYAEVFHVQSKYYQDAENQELQEVTV